MLGLHHTAPAGLAKWAGNPPKRASATPSSNCSGNCTTRRPEKAGASTRPSPLAQNSAPPLPSHSTSVSPAAPPRALGLRSSLQAPWFCELQNDQEQPPAGHCQRGFLMAKLPSTALCSKARVYALGAKRTDRGLRRMPAFREMPFEDVGCFTKMTSISTPMDAGSTSTSTRVGCAHGRPPCPAGFKAVSRRRSRPLDLGSGEAEAQNSPSTQHDISPHGQSACLH